MADVDIIARLKLAGDSFNKEFRQEMGRVEGEAQKSANRLRSSFSAVKGAAVGLVAGLGIERLAGIIGNTVNKIDDLGDAAERLGVSTTFLQKFEHAAIAMDSSVEGARAGLGKFNRVVGDYINGNKAAAKALEETLGVQIEANGKIKSSEQLLYDVSDAIAKLPTQYEKASAVQKIFGRGAEELIPLLSSGSKAIKEWGNQLERTGGVVDEEKIKQIGDMKREWETFANTLQGKVASAVADNAANLRGTLELIERVTLAFVDLASGIGKAVNAYGRWKAENLRNTLQSQEDSFLARFDSPERRFERQKQIRGLTSYVEGRIVQPTFQSIGNSPAPAPVSDSTWIRAHSKSPLGVLRRNFLPEEDMGLGSFAPVSAAAENISKSVMQARVEWGAMETAAKAFEGRLGDMLSTMRDQHDLDMLRAQGLDEQADLIEELRALQADINSIEGLTTAERQAGYEALSQQLVMSRALVTATKQASEFAADFRDNYGTGPGQGINDVIADEEKVKDYKFEVAQQLADKQKEDAQQLADMYENLLSDGVGGVWRDFKRQGQRIIAEIAAQWTLAMLSGQKFSLGSVLGGGGGGILGGAGGLLSSAGSAASLVGTIGGGLGGLGGMAAGGLAVPGIGTALAGVALVGSLIGGLKTKKGSATLGFTNGGLGVVSTSGNSKSRIAAASGAGGTVSDQLEQIAEALGGSLNGGLSVSIGMRKKSYRVDTTGAGRTKGAGVLDFGTDENAAIQAAIRDALQDGVVTGISQASKNILAAGGDIQAAVEKAVSIEQLPKLLRDRLDPVGAAVEAVDTKFASLVATLKSAGASAEQIDQARQLYQLERADALNTQGGSGSLKSFLTSLSAGGSSPFSLRTQRANAQSALDPFLAKIAAGSAIDVDQYLAAAQTFLDVERQIEGSRPGYFATLDRIQAATQQAISRIDGQSSVTTKDPFAELTAQATQATASLTEQSNVLLQQMIAQLGSIGGYLGGGGFIGSGRGFVSA